MNLPAHLGAHISEQTQYLKVPVSLCLENGDELPDLVIAYRTWGDIRNAENRAVLICHALTASADADDWWPNMIGSGKVFDPAFDFIVCANILGSCYGTTGPVSYKPRTTERYRADFPKISVRDMVNIERVLLDDLGIDHLEIVAGPSLGGMQALE